MTQALVGDLSTPADCRTGVTDAFQVAKLLKRKGLIQLAPEPFLDRFQFHLADLILAIRKQVARGGQAENRGQREHRLHVSGLHGSPPAPASL
jgi:hypothetical protein